jgi:hypothetical protein
LFDSLAGVVEVDGVLFDADESLASPQGRNTGRPTSHERIKQAASPNGIADVRNRSANRILARVLA